MKYRVLIQTVASATVDIEVPDDVTDPDEIAERALSEGNLPTLCAQCSGWDKGFSLDLGDWDITEHDRGPHKGMAYVLDESGDVVTGDGAR